MCSSDLLSNLEKVKLSTCEHCLKGKLTRKPFGKATRAEFPLQLIHSDVCSPMNVRAMYGPYYFITFMDDYSKYGHVYLISYKFEALNYFKTFMNMVEN